MRASFAALLVLALCAAPATAIRMPTLPKNLDDLSSQIRHTYAKVESAALSMAEKYLGHGEEPVVTDELISEINAADGLAWTAATNERFEDVTVSEAKRMMGVRGDYITQTKNLEKVTEATGNADIPESFDAREKWSGCIHPIRDQGRCGSCWAFGASEALSDRLCIASDSKTNVVLSPERLVACDWEGNMGCNGGVPHLAWDYMEAFGLPTDECEPYVSDKGAVPKCPGKCADGSLMTKYKSKLLSTKHYATEEAIQEALMTDGPLEAAFDVYQDFMTYKSGVYQHTTGGMLGGHAVKLVGWGVDETSGLKFWTVANSWTTTWGEKGFFRIQRGVNMCNFESGIVAGQASVSNNEVADAVTETSLIADA